MTPLYTFAPDVMLDTPGAPLPVVVQAIRRAAIEFLRESRTWQELTDPAQVYAGASEIDVDSPSGAVPVKILAATYAGETLEPLTMDWLDANSPGWENETGTPKGFVSADPAAIRLYPIPSATVAAALRLRVAYTLAPDADQAPDMLLKQYFDAITSGAKARLMASPGKPYSNPAAADYHARLFAAAISAARKAVDASYGRARLRTRTYYR